MLNGATWSVQSAVALGNPTPRPRSTVCVAVRATNCVAVGGFDTAAGQAIAEHWNGTAWTVQSAPKIAGGSYLSAVVCPASTTCFVVGQANESVTLAERWNGSKWTVWPRRTHDLAGIAGAQGFGKGDGRRVMRPATRFVTP